MTAHVRCLALAGVLTMASVTSLAAETIFYFRSDPGDFIGGGQELTLTPQDVDFQVSRNFASGVSVFMNNFSQPQPPILTFWFADFAAPFGAELLPGAYEGATRFPFNAPEEPGLSISGDGRGCNTLTGRFDVLEAVYDPGTGDVLAFAADFEQHCEGAEPALFGSIRINSNVPLPDLLPPRITITNPLNPQACVEATGPSGATVDLVASVTVPGDYDLQWSTSTGASGAGESFSFELGVGQSAAVMLTLTDLASGATRTATKQVCVSDTTAPQVHIRSPVNGAVLIGNNKVLEVEARDAVDGPLEEMRMFVGHRATLQLDPATGTARTQLPPQGASQEPVLTEIIVEVSDSSGNLATASVEVVLEHDRRR